jgi:hypothetical protein
VLDPEFRRQLGARLVAERQRVIDERARRRARWRLRLPIPRWPGSAIAAAGLAVAAVVLTLLSTVLVPRQAQPRAVAVAASSAFAGASSVDPGSPVVIHFDRRMDQAAVAAALRVAPATEIRTAWRGNDLVVTPLHGLVPNAAYVLTIDRARARTAPGAPLAADVHLLFGTAPLPLPGAPVSSPVGLPLRVATAAADGSEAVIAADGTLVATSASRFGFSGLLRLNRDGTVARLAAATGAICVSRSGHSLAYLVGSGAGASIVMAAADGSGGRAVHAAVDDGSPLGWMNDAEVSFVGGGQLQAVDRAGHVRVLSPTPVDAARDTVAIAPGGRYVFLRPASQPAMPGQGQLVDLVTGLAHQLDGIVGEPAFSADGATVAWVDGSGSSPRLARAPSAGGPVLKVSLPVAAGDELSDLGVGPDASRLVYSVKHADGSAELRLAAMDSGATLAVSHAGIGESPNWSPTGRQVAVLGHAGAQGQIEVADVPAGTADATDAAEALAAAFADAQAAGDRDAMGALAAPGVSVSGLARASRASVVQLLPGAGGEGVRASLRLVTDPTPQHPVARETTETLDLRPDTRLQRLVVAAVSAAPPADVAPGPHVARIAAGTAPGSVSVTFDSDLDPASVAGAVGLRGPGGRAAATVTFQAPTRTVTLAPAGPVPGPLTLTIGTGLRDVAGQHLPAPVQTPAGPGGP